MNNTESEKKPHPSRGRKTIRVPFAGEAQYQQCLVEGEEGFFTRDEGGEG